MKTWYAPQRAIPLLIALSFITMLLFIGAAPLFDPDEPVYGETAKEMILAGNWLSPRIYGEFWYDKPPMFYWLSAISYTLFGISEFTSRLPSALLGMGTAVFVYAQVRRILSDRAAFFSAVVCTTSLGMFYIAKAAVTDMSLIFSLSAAMLCLYRKKYYWGYFFCGIALLVKGPVGYGFPALIMLLYLLLSRRFSLLKEMKIPSGILLAFLVGLPWYIAMYHYHGDPFLDTFIGFHNIDRFTSPEHPGQNSYIRYIPVLFLSLFPWTAAFIPAVFRSFSRKNKHKDFLLFLHCWTWFIFVFFSISKTQLVTYIAPMFVPAAILIGWYLDRLLCHDWHKDRWILGIVHLCLGLAAAAAALLYVPALPEIASDAIPLAGLMLLIALPAGYFLFAGKIEKAIGSAALAAACLSLFMTVQIAPQLAPANSAYEIARAVQVHYDDEYPLYVDKFVRPTLAFYTNIYGTEWQRPFLDHLHPSQEKAFYVMRKAGYKKISYDVMCQMNPEFAQYKVLADTDYYILLVNQ